MSLPSVSGEAGHLALSLLACLTVGSPGQLVIAQSLLSSFVEEKALLVSPGQDVSER